MNTVTQTEAVSQKPHSQQLLDRMHAVAPAFGTQDYDNFVAAMLGALAGRLIMLEHADAWDHALDTAVRYVQQYKAVSA